MARGSALTIDLFSGTFRPVFHRRGCAWRVRRGGGSIGLATGIRASRKPHRGCGGRVVLVPRGVAVPVPVAGILEIVGDVAAVHAADGLTLVDRCRRPAPVAIESVPENAHRTPRDRTRKNGVPDKATHGSPTIRPRASPRLGRFSEKLALRFAQLPGSGRPRGSLAACAEGT